MIPSNLLEWLASLSFDVALVVLFVPSLLVMVIGTLLVRWWFEDAIDINSNVGPTKVQYMAEIYSALLGFLVVLAYAQYDGTRSAVRLEVEQLRLVQNLAGQLPETAAADLRQAVQGYVRLVVEEEWPLMAFGGESRAVDAAIAGMLAALPRREAGNDLGTALLVVQLQELVQDVATQRVARVTAAPESRVADLLSGVLVLVTFLAVAIAWFLRGPSVTVHLILGAIMVITFLCFILLVVELIYPFAGDLRIQPGEFQEILT